MSGAPSYGAYNESNNGRCVFMLTRALYVSALTLFLRFCLGSIVQASLHRCDMREYMVLPSSVLTHDAKHAGITGYNTQAPMSFGTQANPWQARFSFCASTLRFLTCNTTGILRTAPGRAEIESLRCIRAREPVRTHRSAIHIRIYGLTRRCLQGASGRLQCV